MDNTKTQLTLTLQLHKQRLLKIIPPRTVKGTINKLNSPRRRLTHHTAFVAIRRLHSLSVDPIVLALSQRIPYLARGNITFVDLVQKSG